MDIIKANVLIDETEHACLADFGLLTVTSEGTNLASSTLSSLRGTQRWMSPELFDPEGFGLKDSRPTDHSDCYALGMVIYEVLSERVPFFRHRGFVALKIAKGERPERPQGVYGAWFTDVWGILEGCWRPIPADRPRINDVLQCLERVSRSWTPPSWPSATDSPVPIFDFSVDGSADEGEISSASQEVPPYRSQERPKGDPNEDKLLSPAHEFSALPCNAPDYWAPGTGAGNPEGPDLGGSAGIQDKVSWVDLPGSFLF